MWWECSECGCHFKRSRRLEVCDECGTAGAIFGRSSLGSLDSPDDDAMLTWTYAGFDYDVWPAADARAVRGGDSSADEQRSR